VVVILQTNALQLHTYCTLQQLLMVSHLTSAVLAALIAKINETMPFLQQALLLVVLLLLLAKVLAC
jgi:hypothetical protein